MFGVEAADAVMRGEWGRGVALRTPHVVTVPLDDLTRASRPVDLGSSLVAAARGVGICLGDN
jgi:6-phosphofructokinase 1